MTKPPLWCLAVAAFLVAGPAPAHAQTTGAPAPYVTDQEFPLAVWMQDPRHAARYHAAGINLYVALAQDPTAEQLATLAAAHVRLICEQTAAGLAARSSPVIAGWMHGDEPDRAPGIPEEKGGGYVPSKPPEIVQATYRRMKAADPSRPVLLNLSPGAVSNDWVHRGDRANHPEDYPRYVLGSDIVSFDLYPVTNPHPQVAGKLGLIARGVEQLVRWAGPERSVWTCLECTHISNPKLKPTPAQVRSEAWLAIIGGARGLIYFCHEFTPKLDEAAPLDDPEMLAAITAINQQVQKLAPVLATPNFSDPWCESVRSPLLMMLKKYEASLYVFAANPTAGTVSTTVCLGSYAPKRQEGEVLGENRTVGVTSFANKREGAALCSTIIDSFAPYEVHLYRFDPR